MKGVTYVILAVALVAACSGVVAHAQQPGRPPFETTKIDGTGGLPT